MSENPMNTEALRILIDEQGMDSHEIETLLDRIPALANEEQTFDSQPSMMGVVRD